MRYHLTPVRWLKLTTQETTEVNKAVEKGNSLTLLVGMQSGAAAMKDNMEVPHKVKNRATL